MVDHVAVEAVGVDPVAARELEFVERKGPGHPDSLADGIAEAVSRRLAAYYRDEFGRVLHHNTDKVHVGAGRATVDFGVGRIEAPIYVLVGGRATRERAGDVIPVDDLARDAARAYVLDTVPPLTAHDVEVDTHIGATSRDLADLYDRSSTPLANDTSIGVGHAPLSPTERLVRTLEPRIHGELDAVGPDVKVLAVRRNDTVTLTIAAAVLADHAPDLAAYRDVVAAVRALAVEHARALTDLSVTVAVNTADDFDEASVYLTATGTSAEMGDDGAVGRGNRANGLITPHRQMSLEATSGKNPITHVGKLYNVLATQIAERLHTDANADFSSVALVSRIGTPITDPQAVDVATTAPDRSEVRELVDDALGDVTDLADDFVAGDIETF
jgi:S-adenosylmethionine synthetase